jgi:glycolate oxidase
VGEENASDRSADLYVYASDASVHQAMPSAVVRPKTAEEVQAILRYANANGIPVTPRGSGSGMAGHSVPVKGGIVLDMKRMDRIVDIRPQDMLVKVEPGVINDELNRKLKEFDLFFPPTPSSGNIATIGGMIGTNASGNRAVKYGATRDAVLGMKVVLADGSLVTLGTNTKTDASGYQLARLMIASEGTLGVVVEATLALSPIPKFKALGTASFDKLGDAGRAISEIISSGIVPSMLELMDDVAIKAVNNAQGLGLPDVAAIIIFECNGMIKEIVDHEMKRIVEVCEKNNGTGIEISDDPKEMGRIFAGRKKLFPSLSRYGEGMASTSLADDMSVPISRVAEAVDKIHEIADRNGIVMSAYGHCGSGLIHTKILMDPKNPDRWEGAQKAVEEVYDFIQELGGTTSGEHGIALSKAPAMKKERADSLDMMRAIKKALDPNNILNPGKLMDAPDDWKNATDLRYNVR